MASTLVNLLSGGLLGGVSKVIDSIRGKSPEDAAKLAEIQAKYQTEFLNAQVEQRKADLQELQMQADVNKTEAASGSIFVAGWRPGIGWICGAAFACNYVVGPILTWVGHLTGKPLAFPVIDMADLMPVLLGMLGIGGLRTYEKIQGVQNKH
jgi:hypothetical protein